MTYKQNIIYKTHKRIKEAISARKKIFMESERSSSPGAACSQTND